MNDLIQNLEHMQSNIWTQLHISNNLLVNEWKKNTWFSPPKVSMTMW